MMQQLKIWTWRQKVTVGIAFAFGIFTAANLAGIDNCGSRANAAVTSHESHESLSSMDKAAGVFEHRSGNTMKAIFLTLRSDGTETLVSRNVSEDSICGFLDSSAPAWRLNDGLSLFFQVPVYERKLTPEIEMHARAPV
jgi:hypothetical protein